jgi:gliding motility-associated-like protein
VVETLLSNEFGCDSLIITTTTLLPSDTTLLTQTSCNPQDTGVVETLLSNEFGCDSLIITTTTLLPSDTTLLTQTSCNPQDTGVVETLLSNEFGCDSLIITTTTLLPSDTTLLIQTSCNPLDTGVVETLLSNEFGCDSLVITTTTLLPSDTTLLTQTSCNPSDTGVVETLLSNEFGCDSLIITTTTLLPSDTTLLTQTSCNPLDTGVVETLLSNEFGCDSLIITTTTLLETPSTTLNPVICPGDSVLINGVYYSAELSSGVDTFASVNGCDSLVFISLGFFASPQLQTLDTVLCAGEELRLLGQVFDEITPGGTLGIAGQNGCDSVLLEVTVSFSEPSLEILANSPDCIGLGGTIELNNIGGGIGPYNYDLEGVESGLVAGSSLLLEDILPGNYTLTLSDSIGCEGGASITIQEGIQPAVDLGADIDTILGAQIILNPVINFDYDTLIWQPAEAVDCEGCPSPLVIATESLNIQLTAISEEGCVAEDVIQLLLNRQRNVYIPNVFSPNGDGRNDFFTIFADPDQVLRVESFEIYDRWGNQVFLNEDFRPNEELDGWDGTFRGEPMDSAVFVYYARLEFTDGEIELFKGDITLLR